MRMQTLLLDDEQRMLRDSARDFLTKRSPVAAQRALRDRRDARGYDPQLWRDIADLGWPAAALPDKSSFRSVSPVWAMLSGQRR